MTVYIAGPVSGIPGYNMPLFRDTARRLARIDIGSIIPHDVYSPGDHRCPALIWCEAMIACIPVLLSSDAVVFLDGWKNSAGCRREMAIALENKKRIISIDSLDKVINTNVMEKL